MSLENQIEIPQSFMAMYVTPGKTRPNAPQEVVQARYEQCESMACMLVEHAQSLFSQGISGEEILNRCHAGLMADTLIFSENESVWVIRRLAELLDWAPRNPVETK